MAASVAQRRIGTTLCRKWHLDSVLGVGTFGTVYAATHRNRSRVAIKVLHPELSVDENLMIGRWLGEDVVKRRAGQGNGGGADPQEQAFAVFPEVRSLLARQGLHLSGVQRKMVAVARAMMLSPTLLLLDEAFVGLAPVVVNRFTEAVLKIKALGVSILMAESHLAAATRTHHSTCFQGGTYPRLATCQAYRRRKGRRSFRPQGQRSQGPHRKGRRRGGRARHRSGQGRRSSRRPGSSCGSGTGRQGRNG